MFDFFSDLFGEIKKGAYRYQVDSGKQIAIEGYKTVLKIEDNFVAVKLFDGELDVIGSNLKVKQFTSNTIVISGNINEVCKVGDDGAK